jgi:hypothetical protein
MVLIDFWVQKGRRVEFHLFGLLCKEKASGSLGQALGRTLQHGLASLKQLHWEMTHGADV